MYDDGHIYTDDAGTIKWKFAGGPAAEYAAATGYNPYKLVQFARKDSFDNDPDTASMFDDQHVYSKPGQYTASVAPAFPKTDKIKQDIDTKDTTPLPNPAFPIELGVLAQKQKRSQDTFDVDDKNEAQPNDSSMYDD